MLHTSIHKKNYFKRPLKEIIPVNEETLKFSNFSDINRLVFEYCNKEGSAIEKEGFKKALELFHQAAERVPAYKDFLRKNKINHHKILSLEDFKKVPITNKQNYLKAYPLESLCRNGNLNDLYILSSSSGTTGTPFLWPRGDEQELEGALQFELIFKKVFQADKYKTLYIICFAMGTWISGTFCLACAKHLAKRGYPILTVTPGLDRDVTFSLFKNLANNFDQIVFSGYPPYIKDILDTGKDFGINWKKYKIKFLFAAEGFSECWRDYIHESVGSRDNLCTSVNIYGSADAAILGNETPLTTTIRQLLKNRQDQICNLFHDTRLPTLAQYDPRLKYMEQIDRKTVFTTRSGIPLIRYDIGDNGGLYSFETMKTKLSEMGYDLEALMRKAGKRNFLWQLPFVYIFGRADLTVSLYGLLIYPEHIKVGLEKKSLNKYITGKFVMAIEYDERQNPYLLLRVELARNIKATEGLKRKVKLAVITGLKKVNSEYNRLFDSIGDRAYPVVELVQNADVNYFKPGAKQKWTLR